MRAFIGLTAMLLCLVSSIQNAGACTVFVLDDGQRHYYGSNYDWHLGIGYVMVSPAGRVKQGWALPEDPGRPLRWRATYGSLTFVQYGQGLPKGGMNEAGLVIEGLMLHATEYPPPDDRPYVGSTSHFKQYLLDTCATVADVMERLSQVRVAVYDSAPGIHVMVADASGDCAVIEFLNGRAAVYRGDTLPAKVLTNHIYAQTLKNGAHSGYEGSSHRRFRAAAHRLASYRSDPTRQAVDYAFNILAEVSAGSYTKWSVVYDQTAKIVYWRSDPDETLRWIDLNKIDFGCRYPVTAVPVNRIINGEANGKLSLYTPDHNRELVYQAFTRSRDVIRVPEEIWEKIWRWPEKETCAKD